MKKNAGFFYFLIETDFLDTRSYFYQPIKTRVWQHIANQNSCDVTAFVYILHLNTAIYQWECAYYPNNMMQETGSLCARLAKPLWIFVSGARSAKSCIIIIHIRHFSLAVPMLKIQTPHRARSSL